MEVATDIHKINQDSPYYPYALKEIMDAPEVLYVRGDVAQLTRSILPVVAIVGTRKPTPYGVQVTHQLVGSLAGRVIIVSGLAYGIDAAAHETVVQNGGITWAVLGTGLDDESIYPVKHLTLAHKILQSGGLLISEYPPGMPPLPHHFPMRNRIIAGLSGKVVVVEAPESSGALITAKLALDYNREVLAVPGTIFSVMSVGPNTLIAQGATPVQTANDIIEMQMAPVKLDLTAEQDLVYKALISLPSSIDELAHTTRLSTNVISSVLTVLEIKGVVKMQHGKFIVLQ